MTTGTVQIGIDVSKGWLDIAVHPTGEIWREENIEKGIRKLVERFLRECLKTRQKEAGRANLLDDQITTSLPDRPQ